MQRSIALFFAFCLSLIATGNLLATGDIEPKDTVQQEGPGGLDVPTEKSAKEQPAPSPSPAPKPKAPEPKKSSY